MSDVLAAEAAWPKETLDRDYNARASVSVATFEAEMEHERCWSSDARGLPGTHLDLVYDAVSGQALDLFATSPGLRPVFVYLHGGYWRALSKNETAFAPVGLAPHGIATAVVDYRLAPHVNLTEIVREVRAAVAFLWHTGADHGIDPNRIYVGGSSAGGHLTGAVLAGGWHAEFGVPENVVKGAMPFSGLFHLAPLAKTFVQDWLSLTDDEVSALSPALHLPQRGPPIAVVYGDGEPAGFARQSKEFHALWRGAGFESTLIEVANRNHFDVVHELGNAGSELTSRLVRMMGVDGQQALTA